ncbi:MAG: RND transporter, partial [Mesorhizobium sp.]
MPGFERGLATAKGLLLPAFAAALLSGCVVGPDYQKPLLAMPTSWSGQKAVKSAKPAQLSQWWQRLRDHELNALVEE